MPVVVSPSWLQGLDVGLKDVQKRRIVLADGHGAGRKCRHDGGSYPTSRRHHGRVRSAASASSRPARAANAAIALSARCLSAASCSAEFGRLLLGPRLGSCEPISLDAKLRFKALDVDLEGRVVLSQGVHERLIRRTYGRGLRILDDERLPMLSLDSPWV